MSLIVPIMVNDTTIGNIVIHRTIPLKDGLDVYPYDWVVEMNGNSNHALLKASGVQLWHNYSDGALELLRKVLDLATLRTD